MERIRMRTPKIGDIVLYCEYVTLDPRPAIIFHVWKNLVCDLVIFTPALEYKSINYSEVKKMNHWSWPEEEKPKECEHSYKLKKEEDGRIFFKCEKCHLDSYAPVYVNNKAEELIEKIYFIIKNTHECSHWTKSGSFCEIEKLLKEYKGIT